MLRHWRMEAIPFAACQRSFANLMLGQAALLKIFSIPPSVRRRIQQSTPSRQQCRLAKHGQTTVKLKSIVTAIQRKVRVKFADFRLQSCDFAVGM